MNADILEERFLDSLLTFVGHMVVTLNVCCVIEQRLHGVIGDLWCMSIMALVWIQAVYILYVV